MIQTKVYIKKDTHQYFDLEGNQFTSVSKVLDTIQTKFDAQAISRQCAGKGKYAGMSQEQVLDAWDKNRDKAANHGTRVHDSIEQYTKHSEIEETNKDLEPMLKSIASDYIPYLRTYSECILYSPSFEKMGTRIAGTTDRILVVNARKVLADLEDYKTNLSKGIEFLNKDNKYLLSPLEHLQDCNYLKYCLQLSIYGLMYEELTLNKVRSMWLRFIPADDPLNHRRIPVPYMKNDAIAVLNAFHNKRSTIVERVKADMSSSDEPIF